MVLCASKADLYREGHSVDRAAAKQWAQNHGTEWVEVSAKENRGVQEVFSLVAEKCIKAGSLRKPGPTTKQPINTGAAVFAEQSSCSC